MRGVRVRDGDFEGQCDYCHEYLPMTREFWPTHTAGLRRCKACLREYKRLRQQGYSQDRLRVEVWRSNQRAHFRALPQEERARRLAVNRAWKASHREHIAAYNAAYRARKRAA